MTAIFVVCFVSMCLLWIRFNRNAWRRHSEEEEEGKTNTRLCHALQTHSIRHVVTLQCNSLFFDIHKHIFPLCSHHRHSSTLAPHNLKQHAIAYEQREKKELFPFRHFPFRSFQLHSSCGCCRLESKKESTEKICVSLCRYTSKREHIYARAYNILCTFCFISKQLFWYTLMLSPKNDNVLQEKIYARERICGVRSCMYA